MPQLCEESRPHSTHNEQVSQYVQMLELTAIGLRLKLQLARDGEFVAFYPLKYSKLFLVLAERFLGILKPGRIQLMQRPIY